MLPHFVVAADVKAGRLDLVLEGAAPRRDRDPRDVRLAATVAGTDELLLDHLRAWFAEPGWRFGVP